MEIKLQIAINDSDGPDIMKQRISKSGQRLNTVIVSKANS